jgi:hypothetical protein
MKMKSTNDLSESNYKKSLAAYFGRKNDFWREVYDPNHSDGDLFLNEHMRSRKKTVLNFIKDCANGSKKKF